MGSDIKWAAGFFDGEGSVFVNHLKRCKGGSTGNYYACTSVGISIAQTRPEPLLRFHSIIGIGRVNGPFNSKHPNHKPHWRWSVDGRPSVCHVLTALWPHICLPKREQARKVWAELLSLKTKKSPALPPLPEAP